MVPWTAKVGVLGLKLKAETEIAQSFAGRLLYTAVPDVNFALAECLKKQIVTD